MDLPIIQPIFCFLSPKGKVKNVNSIVEPYAMHKKKPVRLFNFLCFFGYLASFCEIEEPFPFFYLYYQGNDPSAR